MTSTRIIFERAGGIYFSSLREFEPISREEIIMISSIYDISFSEILQNILQDLAMRDR